MLKVLRKNYNLNTRQSGGGGEGLGLEILFHFVLGVRRVHLKQLMF